MGRRNSRGAQTLHPVTWPRIFELGENQYLSSPYPIADISALQLSTHDAFTTVIALGPEKKLLRQHLQTTLEQWESSDDVFRRGFLQHVIVTTLGAEDESKLVSEDAVSLLKSMANESIQALHDGSNNIPTGFYVAVAGYLYEVYRLYDDDCGAFLSSVIRGPSDNYLPLTAFKYAPSHSLIAVPSRISRFVPTALPLQGLRVAVKDNFQIKGLRTSLCNRAYLDTYPLRTKTAKCIEDLISLGACIVGNTKLAAFAATEEPLECTDFQAPWNPRADGHQSPAGSSSGSGVAAAAYDWLDIAIGSDTSGSGRRPAHWNGCFALRPSYGVLDLDGLTISFKDIQLCRDVVAAWYGSKLRETHPNVPWKLLVPTDYLHIVTNPQQLHLIDKFVSDLERSLEVKRTETSLADVWEQTRPAETGQQSLGTYMKTACRDSFFYDDYHNLDHFREDYERKFAKAPYVSHPVRLQWALASKISREQRDEAVKRLSVFRNWFAQHIMEGDQKRTIVVLPIENMAPRYRDEATTHFAPEGVPMLFLSPISGGPECVIPIGQVSYHSRVSQREEMLPVGISLLGAPGTDAELLEVAAACLKESGRATKVLAGRNMFPEHKGLV